MRGRRAFDPDAHALFVDWQARRFVWLGGSHVLPQGREKLERIVERYPETIYAVHAELALGYTCDASPLTRDRPRDERRRCRAALARLESAQARSGDVPPSRQRMLAEALARVRDRIR